MQQHFDPLASILEPDTTEMERKRSEQRERADLYARLFGTADGKRVLTDLRSRTLAGPVFPWEKPLLDAIPEAFAREGQNSIVRMIDGLIEQSELFKQQDREAKNDRANTDTADD